MKSHLLLILQLVLVLIFCSCHKDEHRPDDDNTLSATEKVNKFIEKEMKDIYYWAPQVKDSIGDLRANPHDFLRSLMYKDDEWSTLEENKSTTKSATEGFEVSFGYKIMFYGSYPPYNTVVGMIRYVYPNSPAAKAGLKRGDLIVKNNGAWLSMDNYKKVYTDATVKLNLGRLEESGLEAFSKVYELTAAKTEVNPIQLDTILQVEGKKIGYFVYTNFVDNQKNSLSDLSEVFLKFKNARLDDFILDLRYNTGGMVTAARHLSSLLAPAPVIQQAQTLIYEQWNETYTKKYQNSSISTEEHFNPDLLPYNLDLNKIYILIGDWTASASEVVISGLQPYLSQMVLIGEKTVGKYVGSTKRTPSDTDLQNWVLWPISFIYTNANGESVKGGISPHYHAIESKNINYLPPFGSSKDPLLAQALQLITDKPVIAALHSRSIAGPRLIPLNANEGKNGLLCKP